MEKTAFRCGREGKKYGRLCKRKGTIAFEHRKGLAGHGKG